MGFSTTLLILLLYKFQLAFLRPEVPPKPVPPEWPREAPQLSSRQSGDTATQTKYQSAPISWIHGNFIRKAMDLILEKGLYLDNEFRKVEFLTDQELRQALDIKLTDNENTDDMLLDLIDKLFQICPRPHNKLRIDKRVSGLDPLAVMGDWMAVTMSNLVVTYQVSPIWTMMEIRMTEYLSKKIGWRETGDGVPTSGAGVANSLAMGAALHYVDTRIRDIGSFHKQDQLRIYISQHASISWDKAAHYNGIGTDAICRICIDEWGRMDTKVLIKKIGEDVHKGFIPLMIVATAGTPILGAIDELVLIARICDERAIWCHVDAELAGGYLFTPDGSRSRNKLNGIEGYDSVTMSMWLFAAPYPSSMLLTRHSDALQDVYGLHASYVFTGIDNYNMSYDRGDHTIQTSRRPEIAKIWFAAARGEENTHKMFEQMDDTKKSFLEVRPSESEGFFSLYTEISQFVDTRRFQVPLENFYYVPKEYRGKPRDIHWAEQITFEMERIHTILRSTGLLDISLSYFPRDKTVPAFFTMSFTNNAFKLPTFEYVYTLIATIGENQPYDRFQNYPPSTHDESINYSELPNYPLITVYNDLFESIFDIAIEKGMYFGPPERVFDLRQPAFFNDKANFDFSLPYNYGTGLLNKMKELFQSIITYSPHWSHPYFIYQLAAGLDPYTIVADYIVPVLNTPYIIQNDNAGIFILMEDELTRVMCLRVYNNEKCSGTITDGGSMANQMAIAAARWKWNRLQGKLDSYHKSKGMRDIFPRRFIIFTSADAHYSIKKGAILQGIGQNNTIEVESNDIGQMKVDKLQEAIDKVMRDGDIPLMIVITTGTTIYGAIDPIEPIIDICQKYQIWCHVDGMFGGLVVVSDRHKPLFKGIERSDSWGADLHKLMGSTMVCSIFLIREQFALRSIFAIVDAERESQEEPTKAFYNPFWGHVQLDRRNNVFKFWLLWKAKGRKGLELHVNTIMSNKDYLIQELKKRTAQGYELVIDNYDLTNVCFRYIPTYIRPGAGNGIDRNSAKWKRQMDTYTFALEKAFVNTGDIAFVAQHRHLADGTETVMFIKFVMMGSALRTVDIDYFLDTVAWYGQNMIPESVIYDILREDFLTPRAGVVDDVEQHKQRFDPFGHTPPYHPAVAIPKDEF